MTAGRIAYFDAVAAGYDATFTASATGRAQRDLIRRHLSAHLPDGGGPRRVLELNCGTGVDAVWMAMRGHCVLATDAAPAMVRQTAAKAAASGQTIETRCLPIQDIGAPNALPERGFDLVLSNFGGLNCVSPKEIAAFAGHAAALVRPGGRLIAVVMPRVCLWETLAGLARLRPEIAARRWRGGPVTAQLDAGDPFPIWYYAPGALARLFHAGFVLDAVRPIGCAVPPSMIEPYFRRRPALVRRLAALDAALPGRPFAACSDHALLDLRRRG